MGPKKAVTCREYGGSKAIQVKRDNLGSHDSISVATYRKELTLT